MDNVKLDIDKLCSGLFSDSLDEMGYKNQVINGFFSNKSPFRFIGRARTLRLETIETNDENIKTGLKFLGGIEKGEVLSPKTLDMKRAIDSLREELEAVDLYNQRADATNNAELKSVLIHNANEEKEHAAMLIEWLRKNDEVFAKEVADNLFKDKIDTNHA